MIPSPPRADGWKRVPAWTRAVDAAWRLSEFGRIVTVKPSSKRILRRELNAYLGRIVSGRQWVRWRTQQRRAERRLVIPC